MAQPSVVQPSVVEPSVAQPSAVQSNVIPAWQVTINALANSWAAGLQDAYNDIHTLIKNAEQVFNKSQSRPTTDQNAETGDALKSQVQDILDKANGLGDASSRNVMANIVPSLSDDDVFKAVDAWGIMSRKIQGSWQQVSDDIGPGVNFCAHALDSDLGPDEDVAFMNAMENEFQRGNASLTALSTWLDAYQQNNDAT